MHTSSGNQYYNVSGDGEGSLTRNSNISCTEQKQNDPRKSVQFIRGHNKAQACGRPQLEPHPQTSERKKSNWVFAIHDIIITVSTHHFVRYFQVLFIYLFFIYTSGKHFLCFIISRQNYHCILSLPPPLPLFPPCLKALLPNSWKWLSLELGRWLTGSLRKELLCIATPRVGLQTATAPRVFCNSKQGKREKDAGYEGKHCLSMWEMELGLKKKKGRWKATQKNQRQIKYFTPKVVISSKIIIW